MNEAILARKERERERGLISERIHTINEEHQNKDMYRVCMHAIVTRENTDRSERTVLATEAVDGSDEVPMELAGPPEPGHLGPVVPPRRHPVPPTAGATHLPHARLLAASSRPASSLSSVASPLSPGATEW